MEYVLGKLRRLNGPALTLTMLPAAIVIWFLLALLFTFGASMVRSSMMGGNEVKVVPCAKCINCACPKIAGTAQCLCPR
jgi:hypothetical protein